MSFHSLLHDFHNKFQSKMLRAVLTSAITLGGAMALAGTAAAGGHLSLIHISEPTRRS